MFQHLSGVLDAYPGWLVVACIGTAVLAYFLGCFNGAVVMSRYILRDDVRNHGSGNAGLTNFYRTFGGPLTAAVILSDVVKAVLAVLFSTWIFGILSPQLVPFGKYWAGMFCLLGHMYPCTFQFRGGKGILSGGTIAIMIDWRVALVVWGGFLILAILTRYVSLGSCWAGLSVPFVTAFDYRDVLLVVMAVDIGGLILWKHRGNIQRMVHGTESKFTLHKKRESAAPAQGERAEGPEPEAGGPAQAVEADGTPEESTGHPEEPDGPEAEEHKEERP